MHFLDPLRACQGCTMQIDQRQALSCFFAMSRMLAQILTPLLGSSLRRTISKSSSRMGCRGSVHSSLSMLVEESSHSLWSLKLFIKNRLSRLTESKRGNGLGPSKLLGRVIFFLERWYSLSLKSFKTSSCYFNVPMEGGPRGPLRFDISFSGGSWRARRWSQWGSVSRGCISIRTGNRLPGTGP